MATKSCPNCGKVFTEKELAKQPKCCGKPLIPPVAPCTKAGVAEHAGFPDSDRPCDDGKPV